MSDGVLVQFSMLVPNWEIVILNAKSPLTIVDVRNDVFIVRYKDIEGLNKLKEDYPNLRHVVLKN